MTASSEVKKKLGLKTTSSWRNRRAATTGELMRVQMRVTEVTDTRVRRAFLRVAAGQVSFCSKILFISIFILFYFALK